VFDSGSGGLSVLAALRRRLPEAPLVYLGDLAYAPYGDREAADVIARSKRVVRKLIELGATVVVVACNTATVLGIAALRQEWPKIAFVGVEPGVKPAAAATRNRRIAVMATPATAASARLQYLVEAYAQGVHVHIAPCPGLASAIERGADDIDALRTVLAAPCAEIRDAKVDTVVLGCTHYPFVAPAIQQLLGDEIRLIDTATAVAERVAVVCGDAMPRQVGLRVLSTAATTEMTALLRRCPEFDRVEIEAVSI
jgi:glutamate racemase